MTAHIVISNVVYVLGAIAAAALLSGLVMLRHRRPKSLEAGIEMFSRELKALEPEARPVRGPGSGHAGRSGWTGTWPHEEQPAGGRPTITETTAFIRPARGRSARRRSGGASHHGETGRNEAGSSSPAREDQPG